MDSKNVRNLPYGKQTITEEDIENVVEVLKSKNLTQGPVVPQFERQIANVTKSKYSVAFNSATSALHVACLALGLKKDEWIWTSPITFVASANCGRYCGANVDFVDIDPSTGLMDIEKIIRKVRKCKNIR